MLQKKNDSGKQAREETRRLKPAHRIRTSPVVHARTWAGNHTGAVFEEDVVAAAAVHWRESRKRWWCRNSCCVGRSIGGRAMHA
jgi:hypothetical protein